VGVASGDLCWISGGRHEADGLESLVATCQSLGASTQLLGNPFERSVGEDDCRCGKYAARLSECSSEVCLKIANLQGGSRPIFACNITEKYCYIDLDAECCLPLDPLARECSCLLVLC
jgi:hypothetical protein